METQDKNFKIISESVIRRLPRYLRFLSELEDSGIIRVSSSELSEKMGFTASQIRQDFNCFGGFGQQGYGYNVKELHDRIGGILGVNATNRTIVIGAGNLGKAIAAHIDFNKKGCEFIGIFDKNINIAGQPFRDVHQNEFRIMHNDELERFCMTEKPQVAVLCIPKTEAKSVVSRLVEYGVKAFWNFSHYDLKREYDDVIVENVHLSDSLMTLSYGLKHRADKKHGG